MCLAVPMKVIEINDNLATVDLGGTQRTVGLDILDPKPKIGDYVIIHAGFAINVLDEEEARVTLDYFEEMLANEPETPE